MKNVRVAIGKGYDVIIGSSLLKRAGDMIKSVIPIRKVAIISDDFVSEKYGKILKNSLSLAGFHVEMLVFPRGESSKNYITLGTILEGMAKAGFGREDSVIALGGGVVGDISGFAASIYMRGISCIQIPTTLLAAVDSSVGGKSAVDLSCGKNLIGSFAQPKLVLCDTEIISSLPPEVYADGMAEVIKYSILYDEKIPEYGIEEMIYRCISAKARAVEADETDIGVRRALNLGHTAAHAYEYLSNYSLSHGKAVAIGLVTEARIAERLGLVTVGLADKIIATIQKYGLPIEYACSVDEFVEAVKMDKKNGDHYIGFSLPTDNGWQSILLSPEKLLELIK